MSIFTRYGAKRLLKLADILAVAGKAHEKAGEPAYDQRWYVHACGTPACALGHYAAATPARFGLLTVGGAVVDRAGEFVDYDSQPVLKEFGIGEDDAEAIFGGWGCGQARTAKQAAKFIRAFVTRKLKEESHV